MISASYLDPLGRQEELTEMPSKPLVLLFQEPSGFCNPLREEGPCLCILILRSPDIVITDMISKDIKRLIQGIRKQDLASACVGWVGQV